MDAMIDGQWIKLSKWTRGYHCAVRVVVDAIIPSDDPIEPCLKPAAVRLLDELQ